MNERKPNRLIHEKSPYLQQHAYNPVDWYPWGEQAFDAARRMDKPVFLSIGYSTCHWCHVMAHESFEDPEVAKIMNEAFISVKVDREERPDIDQVYMKVCQMMTGRGGWPLSIIMTPDKNPFFAATYIPKTGRFGRAGMLELVPKIEKLWKEERSELLRSAKNIASGLSDLQKMPLGDDLDQGTLKKAYEGLLGRFDWIYGGFGHAPKFPTPHNLLFLLRYWKRTGEIAAFEMMETTLQSMRLGGIYDHLGFGFHRYSTDSKWLLPHFEKMLYDQALLAIAYLEAFQATAKEEYSQVAKEVFEYVLRDMTSPDGGFYSAEDADSERVEGKFYLWTQEELFQNLPKGQAELVVKLFGVEKEGNFSQDGTGKRIGMNVLRLSTSLEDAGSALGIPEPELKATLDEVQKRLFAVRAKRVHPIKDDKILTDWNGLMIAALAIGAQVLGEEIYAKAAIRAAEFILSRIQQSGLLLHRYREGEAAIPGNLDDYAFLVWGLIELYEASFQARYLHQALELTSQSLKLFWDDEDGGLYFSQQGDDLILRPKEIYDGALPSGNSVAMYNLLRLGRLTGNSEQEARASAIAKAFSGVVAQAPEAYTQLMVALDFALGPSQEIVILGDPSSDEVRSMIRGLRSRFLPHKVLLLGDRGILELVPFLRGLSLVDGKATAYVCSGYSCALPIHDTDKLLELIS